MWELSSDSAYLHSPLKILNEWELRVPDKIKVIQLTQDQPLKSPLNNSLSVSKNALDAWQTLFQVTALQKLKAWRSQPGITHSFNKHQPGHENKQKAGGGRAFSWNQKGAGDAWRVAKESWGWKQTSVIFTSIPWFFSEALCALWNTVALISVPGWGQAPPGASLSL